MKAVLQSIKPKYCELIASGKKTVEIRKTRPKIDPPFKVYMYCTKGGKDLIKDDIGTTIDYIAKNGGKVIGEYICDGIFDHMIFGYKSIDASLLEITLGDCRKDIVRFWHISDWKIYDEPKELDEFTPYCEYNIDGECFAKSENVGCDCTEPDLNPDGTVNIYLCTRRLKRPPKSWRYVDELEE